MRKTVPLKQVIETVVLPLISYIIFLYLMYIVYVASCIFILEVCVS